MKQKHWATNNELRPDLVARIAADDDDDEVILQLTQKKFKKGRQEIRITEFLDFVRRPEF
jgi:hypothetical protein